MDSKDGKASDSGRGGVRDAVGGRLGTPEDAMGPRAAGPQAGAPRRIEKPWGYELVWAETDEYVGKLLHVRAGEALSLQFHEEKDETLFLLSGEIVLELGPGVNALEPVGVSEGEAVRILPGVLHRMEAVTDCTVLEASTPQLDDVVPVRDRYGRSGGTGADR